MAKQPLSIGPFNRNERVVLTVDEGKKRVKSVKEEGNAEGRGRMQSKSSCKLLERHLGESDAS